MAGLVLIVTFAGDIFCSRHAVHARGVYRNVVPYQKWEFMSSGSGSHTSKLRLRYCLYVQHAVGWHVFIHTPVYVYHTLQISLDLEHE